MAILKFLSRLYGLKNPSQFDYSAMILFSVNVLLAIGYAVGTSIALWQLWYK